MIIIRMYGIVRLRSGKQSRNAIFAASFFSINVILLVSFIENGSGRP